MVDPTVDPTVRHLPHATGELLFCSAAGPEHAGIPIVAPWFAQTLGEQMHGWARTLPWRRVSATACALEHDGLALTFTASSVDFSLACRNAGSTPRRIQLALHPYWAVDAPAARVLGLDGASYLDKTDGREKRFAGELRFGEEIDFVFAGVRELSLVDATRTVHLTLTGADHAVVWNPGPVECRKAPSLEDGDWERFACLEPALLGADRGGVVLAPGETARIGMSVTVTVPGGGAA